jgi:hypothetical protein
MTRSLPFMFTGGFCAFLLAGCVSSSPSQYVSPRVTGRVLDAQTQQPIKGVSVQRLTPDQDPGVDEAMKGGQIIAQTLAVRTGSNGRFVLSSERDLALFRELGWSSVSVAFDHPGYERFVTNYTLIDAIVTPKGEPLVKAGDIRLRPKSN